MSIAHKVNGSWQKTAGLPPVDSVLSSTSQNPLENRQIYAALADKITASVSNLVNYYKKSETYTQAEVRQLIGAISTLSIKVVAALPTTDISATTIYWVGPDATTGKYDQYIYSNNAWVKTGDTSVNLGDYVTTEALELAIADFLTEDDVEAILASYYTKTEVDTLLNGKQDSLTFDNVPTENSANVVKSGGVYSAVDDVYKVMGKNGAKNLLSISNILSEVVVNGGITFTPNSDGSITVNGTSTGTPARTTGTRYTAKDLGLDENTKYIFSKGITSNQPRLELILRDSNDSVVHNYNLQSASELEVLLSDYTYENIEVRVSASNGTTINNVTLYPMIRLAEDTDSTYQPYAKTNQQLTEDKAEQAEVNDMVNVLGAKNLLPFDLEKIKAENSSGTWEGNVYTKSDVHFTVNDDGTIDVVTEATGASANAQFIYPTLHLGTGKSFIVSGCPADGGSNKYGFRITVVDSTTAVVTDYGDGATLSTDTDDYGARIVVWSGYIISTSIKFKPMLRLASIQDDTYQPYAKTNRQLTEDSVDWDDYSEVGAVNFIYPKDISKFAHGITYTLNSDNSLTLSGTPDGSASAFAYRDYEASLLAGKTVKFKANPSSRYVDSKLYVAIICRATESGSNLYRQDLQLGGPNYQDELVFNVPSGTNVIIANVCMYQGATDAINITCKPMITPVSYNGPYVPYAKTNRVLTEVTASAIANVPNGAINLAKPNPAGTTTLGNVEFVIDSEGKVTANGTASANIRFDMAEVTLKAGKTYKICEPSSLQARRPFTPETYRCYARIKSSAVWVLQNNGYNGSYTPTEDVVVSVGIGMQSGNQVTDEIFAPMLVLDGTDVGDTFYPYAMTNRELTEETEQISGKWLIESTRSYVSVTADGTKTYQTLVNELALALVERAQGLGKDIIMELIGFYDEADFGYAPSSNQYTQMANNATSIACSFATATAASSSTCSFKSVTVHTTLANVYMGRMTCGNETSGNTFTNYLTVKPTSGKKMYVYYRVLKKI